MKQFILVILICCCNRALAQKIDSIYVNLYTDSLKKGTYNYINIDGLSSNGSYLPLDSTHLIFSASAGSFSGNSLWIAPDFNEDKITIKVILRTNPLLFKQFDMYVKKKPDNEKLKTTEEILDEMNKNKKSKKKGN